MKDRKRQEMLDQLEKALQSAEQIHIDPYGVIRPKEARSDEFNGILAPIDVYCDPPGPVDSEGQPVLDCGGELDGDG